MTVITIDDNGFVKMTKDAIAIVWCMQDVQEKAQEMGHSLSDEICLDILGDVQRHHDCNYGITWESIECQIDFYLVNCKLLAEVKE